MSSPQEVTNSANARPFLVYYINRNDNKTSQRVFFLMDTFRWHTHLVESRHSLSELRFDLRQRLGSLQRLLQLLLGVIQTLLKLPVFLFTLQGKNKCEVRWSQTVNQIHKIHTHRGGEERGCSSYLSVEGLLTGQLVFQFIFDIVERRRLPLGAQVPGDQMGDSSESGTV